jgi:murein DD-endopeptidase MepM/ murein hydrolase activator NlpD
MLGLFDARRGEHERTASRMRDARNHAYRPTEAAGPTTDPAAEHNTDARGARLLTTRASRRRFLAGLGALPLAAMLGACGGSDELTTPHISVSGAELTPSPTPSPVATATRTPESAATATATATPSGEPAAAATPVLDPRLAGFTIPIAGACLPSHDGVMPNAPRVYRNGVHEGVDFYNGDSCTGIALGTPIVAMRDGVVTRADHGYEELTLELLEELSARTQAQGYSDPDTLDVYRGRQVWIDHGAGVVTRYCHLSEIAAGTHVGQHVDRGQLVAYVGESGTPESVLNPGTEMHLHAEVRLDDSFLGSNLPPADVRSLYQQLFA